MGAYIHNPDEDGWTEAIPEPFYYRPISWAWKRLTGWRDQYGRKAELLTPWQDWFRLDL